MFLSMTNESALILLIGVFLTPLMMLFFINQVFIPKSLRMQVRIVLNVLLGSIIIIVSEFVSIEFSDLVLFSIFIFDLIMFIWFFVWGIKRLKEVINW